MSHGSKKPVVARQGHIHTQRPATDRVFFLDNIRYMMVLLVVVIHMACGYSHYTTWWAVNDDNAAAIDFILRTLDIFLMPTLFFIAGFFALPSLNKHGTWMFIRKKLVRLGVPWLVGVILLGPVRMYIHDYSRGFQHHDLWKHFMMNIEGAASLRTGFILSTHQFNHIHFWFISLLLAMFILFALLHKGKKKMFPRSQAAHKPKRATPRSISITLLVAGIFSAVWTLFMYGLFVKAGGREPWVVIASILQFQPTRVGLYIICFSMGIFAFHHSWFINGNIPGRTIHWAVFSMLLWGMMEVVLARLVSQASLSLGATFVTLRTWLVFSLIVTFMAFGAKYGQSASQVNRRLAKNSYTIYLIHFFFVLVVQLLMYKWLDLSVYLKFPVGCVVSIIVSYVASDYAVRKYPRIAIASMFGLFAIFAATVHTS